MSVKEDCPLLTLCVCGRGSADCYVVAGGLMRKDQDNFQAVRRASSGVCPANATSTMMFAKVRATHTPRVLRCVSCHVVSRHVMSAFSSSLFHICGCTLQVSSMCVCGTVQELSAHC